MPTLIPHIAVRDAAAAIDFYKKAFGATELSRMGAPDGKRIMHAALKFGDGVLMLADEFPEYGDCGGSRSPQTLGGSPVTIHFNSPDVDEAIATAAAAGATVTMPAADMFWGDRYGKLRDPFGHEWSISTPKQKLTRQQIEAAGAAAFAKAPRK